MGTRTISGRESGRSTGTGSAGASAARAARLGVALLALSALAACGGGRGLFGGGVNNDPRAVRAANEAASVTADETVIRDASGRRQTIWDIFGSGDDPNVRVEVNRYLWNASLDVLNFLPIEAADPFSGVIVMGWGTAPGTSRQYRATVYVQDPALEARSLRVALVTRGGPASAETVRRLEDAILTRARQLRVQDSRL